MVRIVQVVVTGPGFKDIAEQVELSGVYCVILQEIEKCLRGARHCGLQMQIGNKKRSHCWLRLIRRSRG